MITDPKLIEAVILACLEKNPVDFRKVDDAEVKKVQTAIKRTKLEDGVRSPDRAEALRRLRVCLKKPDREKLDEVLPRPRLRA